MARTAWLPVALLCAGCASTTSPSSDGWPVHSVRVTGNVQLGGNAELLRDTVRVRLMMRNQGSTAARVEFGVCAFAVQGTGRHGGKWDNHPAPNAACADFGLEVELRPGENREIPVYQSLATRIRELVPSDYYQVSILIRREGVLRRLAAGGLEL